MLSVSLDVFSSRRNPSWTLSVREERELIDRILADPSIISSASAPTARTLGYRGYLVNVMKGERGRLRIPSRFRIGNLGDDKDRAALWLLDTSDKPDTEVDDYLREYTHRSILDSPLAPARSDVAELKDLDDLDEKHHCASNHLSSDTDFSFWNGASYIAYNNCYNFAANHRTNTFAQPGRISGNEWLYYTCSGGGSVGSGCTTDGWGSACQANNLAIALVIWPNEDFHFYRLCANGHWCHKPGETPATNKDDSGRFITNPQTCDRGPYTTFCTYFHADNSTMFVE